MEPLLILTMKWGTLYGPHYVNNLARGVRKHLNRPHRFICFTDDAEGLEPGIETFPLPELGLPAGHSDTRWRKLALFRKDLFGLQGTALFLDLDQIIVGDLTPFFDHPGPFHIIRDDDLFRSNPLRKRNPKRDAFLHSVGNSSVFRYEIGAHSYILEAFVADPDAATRDFEISQQFQSAQLAKHGHLNYWPSEWCVSFKKHCVPPHLASYFSDPTLPKGAKIVLFAGNPKMDDALERKSGVWYRRIGNVDWLKSAWAAQE
ncbi:hypothetical protein SAMN04488118_106210 [Epibacterium ulvae]|uniref:Glycosyl transferase family 8 n=1 Tax=Epibacterium ulvae TaxID=1156985 RepID=A0A1G5QZT1_9RHOB|nr:hypothetical protein [Epibacterium ulvae]SCZ66579.1 hypothetical protein SAMN04488118_106210 [Epibacterium ulvae]